MLEKTKAHLKKHKTAYLVAGGVVAGVVLGAVVTAVVRKTSVNQIAIGDNITQIAEVHLARRGHPGYIVQCVETGEIFASQRRAAEVLNVNRYDLWKHLHGEIPDVKGYTFKIIAEASR